MQANIDYKFTIKQNVPDMFSALCRRLSVSLWRCSSVLFRLISRCLSRCLSRFPARYSSFAFRHFVPSLLDAVLQ